MNLFKKDLYENMTDLPLDYVGVSKLSGKFYMVYSGDVGCLYTEITETLYNMLIDDSNFIEED